MGPQATSMAMQSAWSLLWGSAILLEPSPARSRPEPGHEFADNLGNFCSEIEVT